MKFTVFISLVVLSFLSCKSNKEVSNQTDTNSISSTKDTVVVIVEKPVEQKDSLIIGFSKTPCFGRCPVYKVKVYASGFATYEGLNFTELLGFYSTRFSQDDIDNIFKAAKEIDYFGLESEYNDPFVSDLPSTISTLQNDSLSHRIVARMNIPEELKIFNANLAVTLQEQDWQPYSEH